MHGLRRDIPVTAIFGAGVLAALVALTVTPLVQAQTATQREQARKAYEDHLRRMDEAEKAAAAKAASPPAMAPKAAAPAAAPAAMPKAATAPPAAAPKPADVGRRSGCRDRARSRTIPTDVEGRPMGQSGVARRRSWRSPVVRQEGPTESVAR